MVWALAGLALQGAGAYTQGQADKREAANRAHLAEAYGRAYTQYGNWQTDADLGMAAQMHDLAGRGYANYDQLGKALGAPQREMAGASGANDSYMRLRSALSGTPSISAPASSSHGFGKWAQNTTGTRYAPMLQSRMNLINQQAGQREMAMYDRQALGAANDTSIDLGRQAAEAQQREAALAAYRRQILEGAQVKYQYQGPSPAVQNAHLYGQGLNLAGSAAMSYGQNQNRG